jgi:hypothetical protein
MLAPAPAPTPREEFILAMNMLRDELGWDEAELGTVFNAIDCHGHVSREQVRCMRRRSVASGALRSGQQVGQPTAKKDCAAPRHLFTDFSTAQLPLKVPAWHCCPQPPRLLPPALSPPYPTPPHPTPRHATPRHATPRHATPRHATPRHATPQFRDIMIAEELRDPSADAELLRHLAHQRPSWWTDCPPAVATL